MPTKLISREELTASVAIRKLLVIWRHPESGKYVNVAEIEQLENQQLTFAYTDAASKEPEFTPILKFPDLKSAYLVTGLPAFLSNRVMTDKRENYRDYTRWLGFAETDNPTPLDILARSGGQRATDPYHIVEAPMLGENNFESRFFVSGLSHTDGAKERLSNLKSGMELDLVDEPGNVKNPRAMLVTKDGNKFGWVPDWLVETIHQVRNDFGAQCYVERVNPDAPEQMGLLVRIEGQRS